MIPTVILVNYEGLLGENDKIIKKFSNHFERKNDINLVFNDGMLICCHI